MDKQKIMIDANKFRNILISRYNIIAKRYGISSELGILSGVIKLLDTIIIEEYEKGK